MTATDNAPVFTQFGSHGKETRREVEQQHPVEAAGREKVEAR
jgi:hypothetical protein